MQTAAFDHQAELPYATFEEAVMKPWTGIDMTDVERFIAGLILEATSESPIKQADIIAAVGREFTGGITDRQVRHVVRNLRRMHGFPICTRKGKPAGYWWARTEAEMEEFIQTWRAQFIDEAQTLSIMIKRNFPQLAGQLKLALEE
jgi:hypothetical protein